MTNGQSKRETYSFVELKRDIFSAYNNPYNDPCHTYFIMQRYIDGESYKCWGQYFKALAFIVFSALKQQRSFSLKHTEIEFSHGVMWKCLKLITLLHSFGKWYCKIPWIWFDRYLLLAQFNLYLHKGGLKPHSFHFISIGLTIIGIYFLFDEFDICYQLLHIY